MVLKINGLSIDIYTSYTIRKSILTQPAQFNMQLGYGELKRNGFTTKDLLHKIFGDPPAGLNQLVPLNAPFQLYVNNTLQQTGRIDGFEIGGEATEIQIHGRDNLALLHDSYLLFDKSFENSTYKDMTEEVLKILQLDERLSVSDEDNLKVTTGVGIPNYSNPETIDKIEEVPEIADVTTGQTEGGQPTNKTVKRSITAKVGETWYNFLQRQYRRAGIFLWAAGDGSFILSEPNSDQSPIYRIVRRRGEFRNAVNVLRHNYKDDITSRYTSAQVYGRHRGRAGGRGKSLGNFVDDIMTNVHFGYLEPGKRDVKPIVFRDVNVSSLAQAEFYGRRKLAEFNRAGFHLQYTVSGHTAPNILTGVPSTWCPNTMVEVDDDELGIHGNYYLEEVVFSRPPTQTTLTLMNPAHLIFKSDDEETF